MKTTTFELKISHTTLIALQVLLPVVWLTFNMQWARHVWVGLIAVLVFLTFFTLIVRMIILKMSNGAAAEKWKMTNGKFSWAKQVFYGPLNLVFAYIMVVYAQHPFLGALIIVAYGATLYETLFNNG